MQQAGLGKSPSPALIFSFKSGSKILMSKYDPNDWPSEADKESALNELAAEMRASKARQNAVSAEQLNAALSSITDFLRTSSTTGGGRRLRQFVWSLWNDSHLINLFDLCHGLDGPLTDAVIIVFHAAMAGVLTEDHLRNLLTDSGEMARWDSTQRHTPEHLDVFYPPYLSARSLKDLAAAAEHHEQSQE
jgi:hypothetical protein